MYYRSAILGALTVLATLFAAASIHAKEGCDDIQWVEWKLLGTNSFYHFSGDGTLSWINSDYKDADGPIGWVCLTDDLFDLYWRNGSRCSVKIEDLTSSKMFTHWSGYNCPRENSGPHVFER